MSTPRRKVLDALKVIAKRRSGEAGTKSLMMESRGMMSNPNTTAGRALPPQQLRYYDLGSGDGETVLGAASIGWRSTGIELNSTLWALSSLRRWFSPSSIRNSSNFVKGDFWQYSIRDADAVMIFGVKPLMPQIASKIGQECQPGTFIMSYRFHVPLLNTNLVEKKSDTEYMTGTTKKEESGLNATLVYDKDEMRIYELPKQK